jgi:peptidoglycan/xylan/chitin deacetylase (PgdA/CDA1 family)
MWAMRRPPLLSAAPLVLAYHAVDDVEEQADPRRLVLSPRRFESQVRFLRRVGYRIVPAAEAADAEGRVAVITFDDGWLSSLTVAAPLLRGLGARATFYVCPGRWGGQHWRFSGEHGRLLDRSGVRELHALGMEIGSHSLTHVDLRTLDDHALREELVRSKEEIEALTGEPCVTFAYPFGLHDERVERAAEAAGYRLAFAWLPGPWRPYAAPRLPAPPRLGAAGLALKLLGVARRGP